MNVSVVGVGIGIDAYFTDEVRHDEVCMTVVHKSYAFVHK